MPKTLERKIVETATEIINEKYADDPELEVTATVGDENQTDEDPTDIETPESRHYAEICNRTIEVQAALAEWHAAKDLASSLKKDYDRLNERLLMFISAGPDRQKRLFTDLTDATADAWRGVPIAELKIPAGLVEKLETEGLNTLGLLQEFWMAGKQLHDIIGIGPEKSAAVADAFADYGAAHPEMFGDQAEAKTTAEDTSAEADVDDQE